MLSSCPNCLTQVEHPDSQSQVACPSCAEVFSPFLTAGDAGPPDSFAESTAAFQDIVAFGESTYSGLKPKQDEFVQKPVTANTKTSSSQAPSLPDSSVEAALVSGSAQIPGYRVVQTFRPISLWAELENDAPLDQGLKQLQSAASSVGANAVLEFRFSALADGSRALLFGIPALCQAE